MDEMQECRVNIGRMDTLLEEQQPLTSARVSWLSQSIQRVSDHEPQRRRMPAAVAVRPFAGYAMALELR